MSSSSNTDPLTHLIQPRNQTLGLNLSAKQAVNVPSNLKCEFVIISSTSQPQFGSYLYLILKKETQLFQIL